MKIWKWNLEVTDLQTIEMPEKARIMTAQFQNGELAIWAEVDPELPPTTRTIEIIGTGNPVPDAERRYIATVQESVLVWHIYERLK